MTVFSIGIRCPATSAITAKPSQAKTNTVTGGALQGARQRQRRGGNAMMDLHAIRYLNEKIAKRAKKAKLQPHVVTEADLEKAKKGKFTFSLPNLGYFKPKGWIKVNHYFVDKTGWGRPGELALTIEEFIDKMIPGRAYALIEEGEMQCYVGEFVRE
jgi:hypothetical protein